MPSSPGSAPVRLSIGIAWSLTFAAAFPAVALDPHRAVTQYSVRTWRGGADFPQDPTIQAIAQTADGYLWLGTMEGLLRFDGVRTTRFARTQAGLPHDNVWGLRVDTDGRLWAGTDGGGLVLWKNGPVQTLTSESGLSSDVVRPILQTRDGALWVGTARHGLNRYKDGRWMYLTTEHGLADNAVWSLAEAADGSVWVGAGGVNLCRGDASGCAVVRRPEDGLPGDSVSALTVTRNGDLWGGHVEWPLAPPRRAMDRLARRRRTAGRHRAGGPRGPRRQPLDRHERRARPLS